MSARRTVRGACATVFADVTAVRAALTGAAGVRPGRRPALRSDRLDRAAIVHIRLGPSPHRRGRPRTAFVIAGCGSTPCRAYLAVALRERE